MNNIHKVVVIFTLFISANCLALSGNEYRDLNGAQQESWVAGVIDGLLTEELIRTGAQPKLAVCLADYKITQMAAIFLKHLNENPEAWHHPAAFSFRFKFRQICGLEN